MAKADEHEPDKTEKDDDSDGLYGVPEIIRRFAALGLSGFFTTESALRKALGDTVPKEWTEFAAAQSERTRQELLDRIASEFGRVLGKVEPRDLLEHLIEGRTIEVSAKIRLGSRTSRTDGSDSRGESASSNHFEIKLGND